MLSTTGSTTSKSDPTRDSTTSKRDPTRGSTTSKRDSIVDSTKSTVGSSGLLVFVLAPSPLA